MQRLYFVYIFKFPNWIFRIINNNFDSALLWPFLFYLNSGHDFYNCDRGSVLNTMKKDKLSLICSKFSTSKNCPVCWGCRIHQLHLSRGVRPLQMSVLHLTVNNLTVTIQRCWSFGEYREPLHCHCSHVHSGPAW